MIHPRLPQNQLVMIGVPVLIIGAVSAALRETRKTSSWGRVECKRRAYLRELAEELRW